jgi:tetratricopeptide (TPR) repeat protein
VAIPSSLQASLLARLDRLAPVKEVAQIGAAIGREFAYDLLAAVAGRGEAELQRALGQLEEAGLVFGRGTPPTATYLFKHALVQDAAYSTLLRDRRQALHARIALALENEFPDVARIRPEILAHHCTQAGLGDQAATYWQSAGEHALQRSANVEAIGHFRQAIELMPALPEGPARDGRELELQLSLGPALMARHGYGAIEVETTYARARDLCRHLDSGPKLFATLRGLWEYYEIRAHTAEAGEIVREVLRIAEQSGDRTLRVVAHDVAGDTALWTGDFAGCIEHTRQAIALYDPAQDGQLALSHGGYDPTMAARVFGAHALWYIGYADLALKQCEEAIAFARALDHPPTSAMIAQVAMHHGLRGEPDQARRRAEDALELARAHDFKFWHGHASISHGWAVALQGDADGIEELQRGIAAYRATGAELEMPIWSSLLAEALLTHDRTEEALVELDGAIARARACGVRVHLSEMERLRGEALARTGRRDDARSAVQRALEIACAQGAKSLEARCRASVARLG